MSAFSEAADKFVEVLRTHRTMRDLEQGALAVHKEIPGAAPAEMNEALPKFLPAIQRAGLIPAGSAAVTCGAMVEFGADPEACGEAILDRLPELLPGVIGFLGEVNRRAGPEAGQADLNQLINRHINGILEVHRDAAWAYIAQRPLTMGAIAHLCKSKRLRAAARGRPDILHLSRDIDRATGQKSFLTDILRVLDDERLVVLHPGEGKGAEVRVSGLADNFQLHTLLADALIGDPGAGKLAGTRPDPATVAAAGSGPPPKTAPTTAGTWNLWNWPALEPGGTLPPGMSGGMWTVWNEGTPADILPFDGVRVVLLGPAPYARAWSAVRRFPRMAGEVAVEKALTPEEVRGWLARLTAAPKPAGPGV